MVFLTYSGSMVNTIGYAMMFHYLDKILALLKEYAGVHTLLWKLVLIPTAAKSVAFLTYPCSMVNTIGYAMMSHYLDKILALLKE